MNESLEGTMMMMMMNRHRKNNKGGVSLHHIEPASSSSSSSVPISSPLLPLTSSSSSSSPLGDVVSIDDLLHHYETNVSSGLSLDEVLRRRRRRQRIIPPLAPPLAPPLVLAPVPPMYNIVSPPIQCPAWVCCLLPCIKYVPSMIAYRAIQPEDAEVLRDSQWIRYDATALVVGDIIRVELNDIVPADCLCIHVYHHGRRRHSHHRHDNDDNDDDDDNDQEEEHEEDDMLVDVHVITGDHQPIRCRSSIPSRYFASSPVLSSSQQQQQQHDNTTTTTAAARFCPTILYYGGRVLCGSGIALVTAIGSDTQVAQYIQQGTFPHHTTTTTTTTMTTTTTTTTTNNNN
jgi:hypothetical protein